jgi:murein DD-endopeptidase MepM/ murein hydrolase activator NlpD
VQLVTFRVSDAERADVTVGGRAFPSFPYGATDKGARVALVALPYDYRTGTPVTVSARDEAGNVATRGVGGELKPRAFPRDTIKISEAFLQAKVPELLPQRPPSQSLLDAFLVINRDQRTQAETVKHAIGGKTADTPLWEGPFVQPRNTKVFSNFAETRTYVYDGRSIDTQVHYGYDLASTKHSPVPAANAGVVAFAGPLTIYGNTVILDHGLGLQTLYAHLSSIEVKVGDKVAKGQALGRTGATGLAVGDHLHFEVLVSGVSVTPLEWWDAKWIRDRVNRPLKDAGLPEIAGLGALKDDDAAPASAPRAPRRRAR